jgi:AraC-like DNA-binding protein
MKTAMTENTDPKVISKKGTTTNMAPRRMENMDTTAFRIIMMMETGNYLRRLEANQLSIFTQKFHKSISNTLNQYKGIVAQKDNKSYLVFFTSATNAILCALKIQADFKYITPKFDAGGRKLKMGISAGVPKNVHGRFSGKAVAAATRMCEKVADQLVISSAVKTSYENENRNAKIDKDHIRTLKPREEEFLRLLIDYCEANWSRSDFDVSNFSSALGFSNSQLYRRLKKLTGKSPNAFIREFRLQKALRLLHTGQGSISKIASAAGFNSPTYFTRCFTSKFGILPSKYLQQHTI